MAVLLAGCLTIQTWIAPVVSVQATTHVAAGETQFTSKELDADAPLEKAGASVAQQNALEVEVISGLPLQQDSTVEVAVKNGADVQTKTLKLSSQDAASSLARFSDLKPGEYEITVSAKKFADYRQTVAVENGWISKIQVYSAQVETGAGGKPGWISLGDVNGDRVIKEKDTKIVLQALHRSGENANADLNGDGKVDLVDLQYLTQSIDEEAQLSTVEKLALPSRLAEEEGTVIAAGSLQALLTDAGSVTLSTSDGIAAISEEHPVGIDFSLTDEGAGGSAPVLEGITIQAPTEEDEEGNVYSSITSAEIEVEDADNVIHTFTVSDSAVFALRARASQSVTVGADGSLTLNFGSQIAIKRVRIKITGTRKEEPLVNIAKVEFVNHMEERIAVPQLDIPAITAVSERNEALTVSWSAQNNVTGYDVYVSGPVKKQSGNETQIVRVFNTSHEITSINNKALKNFETYEIKVRSVNGDWKSPWSDASTVSPKPQNKPAAPDYLKTQGGYRTIQVSWKDMDDSNGYMVYYKAKDDSAFKPVVDGFTETQNGKGKLSKNSYTITGLEEGIEYEIYVKGWNELGWGAASLSSFATTKLVVPPQLPNYKLINTPNGEGVLTSHIKDAVRGTHEGTAMIESPLDKAGSLSAWGVVDNDYASYWTKTDWDDGVAYPVNNFTKGIAITFDAEYKMSYLTFAAAEQNDVDKVRIWYWNETTGKTEVGAALSKKFDENNNPYYIAKFTQPITANKILMCLGRGYGSVMMKVGEMHFHYYDSLEDDIMNLYEDDMHIVLRKDVTEATIQALEDRVEQVDSKSGEKHPLYSELKLELKNARDILAANLDVPYEVKPQITAQKDGHLKFSGLNAWQPLGKVANAGERLIVYVGHPTRARETNSQLQLVMTQYHAEANSLVKTVNLKVGRNELTIPNIVSQKYERGGQLYVAYTGNTASDRYSIRINGGNKIPVLNLYGKSGKDRTDALGAYVQELEEYVTKTDMETRHAAEHAGKGTHNQACEFDQKNCILNATDILLEDMMYSVPATQVWAGIQNATDKAAKLDRALKAMEDTMMLFYQHKGLSDTAGNTNGNNALPSQHLNIRYMRMFAGAFMYASGNHIGVEWSETKLASSPDSWDGFGWGIGHEIGHNINENTYAVAEITNNYFAQLLTMAKAGTRFQYNKVYEKVTSGTIGASSSQATQLALYWQLHLAYDNVTDDRHIFDSYQEQFDNLFFARVDTYSRNPAKAPQAGLTLGSSTDQNLMRLACAAANKNILPFFERWGMLPDADTAAYAEKYGEPETKALYYVNDAARDYRAAHLEEEKTTTIKGQDVVTASAQAKGNQVRIDIRTEKDKDLILGYEIVRSMTTNGKTESGVVGFVPIDTAASTVFTDTVTTINNRVMSYEVRAVDKFLNYANAASAGSAKIETKGELSKAAWTVETNMTSQDDVKIPGTQDDPDSGYHVSNPGSVAQKTQKSINRIIDSQTGEDQTYMGSFDGTAEIIIDMHKKEAVTSLLYKGAPLQSADIQISEDGTTWTTVKEKAAFSEDCTIWFDSVEEEVRDKWIGTYDARYVKIVFESQGESSIQEIGICGPTGDNLEFYTANGQLSVGVLKEAYQYGSEEADVIPKGSLVFTGTYKGNPAYNTVLLYDTEGNVIGAKDGNVEAEQVIFADVPAHGNLGETSEGIWVYYVMPGQWNEETLKEIKGVRGELYRVDNAITLEGERMVSDTMILELPDTIPEITLTGNK